MKVLVLAAAIAVLAGAVDAATLKIAAVTGAAGACHALGGDALAGQKAYYKLLHERLGRDIQECPVATRAAAAQALASGAVDMAVLDPAAFAPVKTQVRAILTVRPTGSLNRLPVLALVKAGSPKASIASLKGGRAVFGGPSPAALTVPKQALADQGAGAGFFAKEEIAADPDAAAAALRSGAADVMVLNAASHQRLCRGKTPAEKLCDDLKIIWKGRPEAKFAVAVRRDIPDELRFRLIGIHVAMHIEAKDAFAWASNFIPQGAEFEPTEADALALAAR